MKRLFSIMFFLGLVATAVAQGPQVFTTIIDDFRGLVGGAPTDLPAVLPMDIMNFDFHTAGTESGPVAIRKRSGFEVVGNGFGGATGGAYRFSKTGVDPQLLATFGNQLYIYSPAQENWTNASGNPLACSCKVTNGDDTIRGLRSSWWIPSTQIYDSIGIGAIRYRIRKLYSDSLLIIADTGYRAATSDAVPCTLVGNFTAGAASQFENPNVIKPGIVYNDSLYVYTKTERVAYGGGVPPALAAATIVDSIPNNWRRTDMTMQVFVKLPSVVTGSWVQMQIRNAPRLNIALYCTERTPTSIRVRCDTNVFLQLTYAIPLGWYAQVIPAPTYTQICSTRVATVAKDSVLGSPGSVLQVTDQVLCTLQTRLATTALTYLHFRRTRTEGYPRYIYRYKVRSCSSGCTVSAWPKDSLTWMTTLAESWLSGGQYRDSGLYRAQIPVLRDSDATGPYLAISTYGGIGGTASYSSDTTSWQPDKYNEAGGGTPLCGLSGYSYFFFARNSNIPCVRRTHGAVDWIIFPGSQRVYGRGPQVYSGTQNYYVDSAIVICFSAITHLTVPTDGATSAYDVGDTIVVRKQVRAARPTLTAAVKVWSAWDYPIATLGMDRIWLAGAPGFPNLITATKDSKPDTIAATTQVNVYDNDGSYITALWFDQNILYAGKPVGIFLLPINITGTDALEPAGCFPTRSTVGPLSQQGIAKSPDGWAFIGFDGVYSFDGSNSTLLSGTMTDFWRDSLDAASLSLGAVVYDYSKNRLMVSVTQKGQSVNSTTLVYDVTAKAWTRYSIAARFWSVLSHPSDKPVLYWGAPDQGTGRVCRMADVPSDSGEVIDARWRSGWLTLGGRMGQRASLWEWMLEMRRSPNANIVLDVYLDGSNTSSDAAALYGQNVVNSPYASIDIVSADTLSLWTTYRAAFPLGWGAERFSFQLQVLSSHSSAFTIIEEIAGYDFPVDDSCEISGLRIDAVPEGKSPW